MLSGSPSSLKADQIFLISTGILAVFGLVALLSASTPVGYAKYGDAYFFVKRQILNGFLPGVILFLLAAKMDYKKWERWAWLFYGLAVLLLALVFVPGVGATINGSHSWLRIFGVSFQPSELAKLAIIILLAKLLLDRKRDWNDWQSSLVPVLAMLAPALALILFQPDVGTLSIVVAIVFVMLYLAKVPNQYLLILGLVGLLCFIGLIAVAPYRASRFTAFLHPELDPKGIGYQTNQAFLAVGSGGLWGLGWGQSRQKFQYLPEVNADSIFAIIAEETGFIFSVFFVIFILFIASRGWKIAKGANDEFGYLLVGGIMVWLVWQSFLNIGAMVGALPLTGVPLPFVSHGGSALMTMFLAMGIVVNVSKTAKLK